jgi:hypothetical protein
MMEIDQVIKKFKERFEKQSHLSPFFRLQEYTVMLATHDKRVSVHIRKRSCNVLIGDACNDDAIEIMGSSDAIQSLIEGKVKLSDLIRIDNLQINAPYRTILKLESIFYLSGQQSRNAI